MAKDPLMAFPGHHQTVMKAVSSGLEERGIGVLESAERLAQRDDSAKAALATICDAIANLVRGAVSAFTVTVDYGKRLSAMIKAGKYDWVNSDITEKNFPPTREEGVQPVTLELIHFDRAISSEDALAELDTMGFRPANLEELLAFGAKYSEEQRKYPIVALGSVWRRLGDRYVPILWDDSNGRRLRLRWFAGAWYSGYRFLAVRK